LFLLISSQKSFLTKKAKMKIDSAASSRSQGKLADFMQFLLPPLEAGLSISKRIPLALKLTELISPLSDLILSNIDKLHAACFP
jgi:hypothetical protein